jgi:hypothetical protein
MRPGVLVAADLGEGKKAKDVQPMIGRYNNQIVTGEIRRVRPTPSCHTSLREFSQDLLLEL